MCFVALGLNTSKMRDLFVTNLVELNIWDMSSQICKKKRRQYLINLSYIFNCMYKYCVALLSSGVP